MYSLGINIHIRNIEHYKENLLKIYTIFHQIKSLEEMD